MTCRLSILLGSLAMGFLLLGCGNTTVERPLFGGGGGISGFGGDMGFGGDTSGAAGVIDVGGIQFGALLPRPGALSEPAVRVAEAQPVASRVGARPACWSRPLLPSPWAAATHARWRVTAR